MTESPQFANGGVLPPRPTASAAALQAEADQAARIAAELAEQAAAARQAEIEASRPKTPDLSEGPVIVGFEKYQSGRTYAFAAIGWKQGPRTERWAVTGNETRRFNWAGLLNFIGEANWSTLHIMRMGPALLPLGAEPPVAERMGRYGRVAGVDTVTPYVDR